MQRFKNILVGVDLSRDDWLVSSEFPAPSAEAVEQALWLAKANSSRLTLLYALDISARAQHMLEEDHDHKSAVEDAQAVLDRLISTAAPSGMEVESVVTFGRPSKALVDLVNREHHDLVVAGTRHQSTLAATIFGSTAVELLRTCPCPVWITEPQANKVVDAVLVAHCLTKLGDTAMELGCSMAQRLNAQLHVLHCLGVAEPDGSAEDASSEYASRRSEAERYIRAQMEQCKLSQPPQFHVLSGNAGTEIARHVEQLDVDVLVMGIGTHTGLAGWFSSHMAEQLLPKIRCSLLAAKPSDSDSAPSATG